MVCFSVFCICIVIDLGIKYQDNYKGYLNYIIFLFISEGCNCENVLSKNNNKKPKLETMNNDTISASSLIQLLKNDDIEASGKDTNFS